MTFMPIVLCIIQSKIGHLSIQGDNCTKLPISKIAAVYNTYSKSQLFSSQLRLVNIKVYAYSIELFW